MQLVIIRCNYGLLTVKIESSVIYIITLDKNYLFTAINMNIVSLR